MKVPRIYFIRHLRNTLLRYTTAMAIVVVADDGDDNCTIKKHFHCYSSTHYVLELRSLRDHTPPPPPPPLITISLQEGVGVV